MRFKTIISAKLLFIILLGISNKTFSQKILSYVDPFIGSGSHGHVFVGASVPFGAVQVGPDNFYKGWDWCSGYNYQDSMMIGFAQTHLSGTGIGDLADILMMPYTGTIKLDKGIETKPGSGYASKYSHKTESAKPGYYSVKLLDYNIDVQLTASERVGFHQYHFPAGKQAWVIIDLKEGINDRSTDTYIRMTDQYTLEGYRYSSGWAKDQRIYFAIKSKIPLEQFSVYNNDSLLQGASGKGNAIKGLISFRQAPANLQLKVGISPVSAENALANIQAEIPHWNFEQVVKEAEAKWEKELSKVAVQTNSNKDKRIFYTALYHTMINPSLFNDHNGDYRGTDKKVYEKASFQNYSVFSLWDTYRATNPLFTVLHADKVGDMVNSMLAIHQQQGRLPIWHLMGNETGTMPGLSSIQVIAEAYLKGIKGFNADTALAAMRKTTEYNGIGLNYILDNKNIPSDKVRESVARAMEYSIGDGSAALMAKKMGRTDDYNYFLKRSKNYQLYFDAATKFFRGKREDGTWNPQFIAARSSRPWINDYSEGNAWQYLWLAPQDIPGLMILMGGEQQFNKRLDSLFSTPLDTTGGHLSDMTGLIGQYVHGNEPSHHITYLYTYGGQQWKTAEKVRYIMNDFYHDQPAGIIGNEDCGQMSAWYVFSALGFYPVFPASTNYVIGSPLFDKASIAAGNGKTFTVEAVNNSPENIYVQSVQLNGKPWSKPYISHTDITKGGVLKIYMGKTPNYNYGKAVTDRPL
ncbi:MAG: GH92 family glycosyl hydrolase [Chitinophagaceae bacterium]